LAGRGHRRWATGPKEQGSWRPKGSTGRWWRSCAGDVGAGISPDEAKKLRLPEYDYVPCTLEERIVCFADKMVDADKVRPFGEEVRRFTVKSHDVGRLLGLKRGLAEELGGDPEKIVFDKIKEFESKAAK